MSNTQNAENLIILETVKHVIYLERYKRGQRKYLKKIVDSLYNEIINYFKTIDAINFPDSEKLLLQKVANEIRYFTSGINQKVTEIIPDLIQIENAFYRSTIQKVCKPEVEDDYRPVQKSQLSQSQDKPLWLYLNQEIAILSVFTQKLFNSSIMSGVTKVRTSSSRSPSNQVKNETPEDSINSLVSELKNNYALTIRQLQTVFDTSTTNITSSIKSQTVSNNAAIYQYERYTAIIDNKTTTICRSRDGKIFKVGTGPTIPAHYNCRSRYILYPKPALFKQNLPDYRGPKQNQELILKKKPLDVIQAALGQGKGSLLKAGLTLDKFWNSEKQQEFTLQQLISQYPDIAQKAGLLQPTS